MLEVQELAAQPQTMLNMSVKQRALQPKFQ